MTDPLLRTLSILVSAVVIAGLPVLLLVRRHALRRPIAAGSPHPLSAPERAALRAWERRLKTAFAVAMTFVATLSTLLVVLRPVPVWIQRVSFIVAMVVVAIGMVCQFSGWCPRCGYNIGLQSRLLLPARCERCHTPFGE